MFPRLSSLSSLTRRHLSQRTTVPLSFSNFPTTHASPPGLPPILMLHGVLASEMTYRSIMNRDDFAPARRKLAVDLRNHGKSPHVPPEDGMSYEDMSRDVLALMDGQDIEKACVIGHSMGGKVAMELALSNPERVSELIVVDITPSTYVPTNSPDDSFNAITAMKSLDFANMRTREDVDAELQRLGVPSLMVRQFVMTNLVRNSGEGSDAKYRWKVNVHSVHTCFPDILAFPERSGKPFLGSTCLIRGEKSRYVPFEAMRKFTTLFPNTKLITISGAGHWLQSQKPDEFCRSVNDFLKN